jgi:hypothetical protein
MPTDSDRPHCTGVTATGEPCQGRVIAGMDACISHADSDKRCTARSKGRMKAGHDDERCGNWAAPGQTVCRFHGGASKRSRTAGKRRQAEQEVKRLVVTFGLPRDIAPEAALLEEIHRTAGAVAWLEAQIRDLSRDALTWGTTKVKEGGEDRGTTEEAVPHVLLRIYQTERAHLVKVCTEAIRVGLEERQVKLAESQGALVAHAITAILDDLKLTAEQRALVPSIVPKHLRALAATTAATN